MYRGSREEEADEDEKGEWALGKENGCGLGLGGFLGVQWRRRGGSWVEEPEALRSTCDRRAAGVEMGAAAERVAQAQRVCADGTDEAKDGAGWKALEGDGEGAVRERARDPGGGHESLGRKEDQQLQMM